MTLVDSLVASIADVVCIANVTRDNLLNSGLEGQARDGAPCDGERSLNGRRRSKSETDRPGGVVAIDVSGVNARRERQRARVFVRIGIDTRCMLGCCSCFPL